MKITVQQHEEAFICRMPDDTKIEFTMVSLHGEDVIEETDPRAAVYFVQQSLAHFESV